MPSPLVSIITPNLNGRHHLEPFLESVADQDFERHAIETIIVDNGSSDGSLEFLAEQHPEVQAVRNASNAGFARANNQGAKIARGRYLAFLNNDTRLERDWVSRIVDFIESAPDDVVCVGSRILSWDGSTVDFIDAGTAFSGRAFQPSFGAPANSDKGRAFPRDVLFPCGAAMLIDRETYLRVGGFDDDYFAYFEDVDLGWRLWVLGYRVAFCPEAVVYHRRNASQPLRYKQAFLLERNALFTIIKNYDDRSLALALPGSLLLSFKRASGWSGISPEEFKPSGTPAEMSSFTPLRAQIAEWLRRVRRRGPQRKGTEMRFAVHGEAHATVAAVADVIAHLPRLMEKRRQIQQRRRRPDAEIVPLFREPFKLGNWPASDDGGFSALAALGVVDYFDSLVRQTETAVGSLDGAPDPATPVLARDPREVR